MRITRRRILLAVLALVLVGIGSVAWTLAGMPPVKYYLRYGLDPYCEPTGGKEMIEGIEFVEVGPGIFRMGSAALAGGGDWLGRLCRPLGLPWGRHPAPSKEMPVHWVEFRRGFWIASTEITNALYKRFDDDHVRNMSWKGDETPVTRVTWGEAKEYCSWLGTKSGRPIRLPSEAEWECACRAGSEDEFTFGDDEEALSEYAWFGEDLWDGPRAVATKRPNRWGLSDLHGNVWEWCEDTAHPSYDDPPNDGLPWVNEGAMFRVVRGVGRYRPATDCRSAARTRLFRDFRGRTLGFRPAFVRPEN